MKLKEILKNKRSYDLFVSLGYGCPVSRILRKLNLQFLSLPFDWVYGTDILGRAKIIQNDFKDYLAKDSLELFSQATGCDCYKNKNNEICFVHDFKLNTSLDETFSDVYEKYKRRASRLIKMIQKSKRVCFVYITTGCDKTVYENELLIEAQKILAQRFLNTKIDILYFENSDVENINNYIDINKNIRKYIFNHASEDKNMPWEVDDEKISQILNNYKISYRNLSLRNILQKYNIYSVTRYQKRTKIIILGIKIKFKN